MKSKKSSPPNTKSFSPKVILWTTSFELIKNYQIIDLPVYIIYLCLQM